MRKLSTVDYPGKLCMDLTVAGCNYRCPYCPKEELIFHYIPKEKIKIEDLIKTLRPRLDFLDGVSLSGGEPLLHRGLIDLLRELKFQGSLVKINTNASKPKVVRFLLDKKLVDYFSVFIPAPISRYKEIVNYNVKVEDVMSAIQMIRKSGLDHDFRVKPVPNLIGESELLEIANYLAGAPRFIIERFEPEQSLSQDCRRLTSYSEDALIKMREMIKPYFNETYIQP